MDEQPVPVLLPIALVRLAENVESIYTSEMTSVFSGRVCRRVLPLPSLSFHRSPVYTLVCVCATERGFVF